MTAEGTVGAPTCLVKKYLDMYRAQVFVGIPSEGSKGLKMGLAGTHGKSTTSTGKV
jgi:hypothetical protein